MAKGLCNAQDISNTLWAVAEGGYTSMHAPVLNAAAQGLQVNNVLLATPTSVAPANSTQSLQAAANTAWAVQQILSSSSSSSSSSKHKQRQQLDAGLQEVALQVAAYCAAALKGPLLSHYTHVTDIKGTGVFSADGTGEEKACTGNEEGSIRELGLKSEAVRAAPASVLSAGAEGAGILGTGAVVPAATAAAAAGATTATAATAAAAAGATTAIAAAAAGAAASAAGAPPAGGAGAAATSAGATAGMAGVPMGKDKRSPIQGVPALKKGWGSSACMGVCALANIGYYEMELWSLAVWVTLQEAAQQQRWHEPLGHARWEAREQQQQQQQEQQCQQQQWQQQQQQQQQLEQQQEQEQQGVDRDLGTSVAGALWACARVGHGLHGWHLSQGSPPLPSALPHAHTLQGRVYSDLLALMLLAGSQHGATDAPAPRSPQHSSSSSSNNSDSWAGRGEARSMQGSGDDMQASSGDGQASASHEQASSVYTQASARSVSMALFALAVLWPVLLAEEHRKESRESIDTHSTTSSSSISGGGNSCAFSASSSTQHALRNAAHGSPNVPSASSSLQQSALALFGAAAAHHPTHFSEPGLTQLQMAYMEVTESGLLSLEQLQAVGWLQPTAHLGIPPTHAPISHSPTSCSATETQPEALLLPRHTEARTGGLPGEARDLAGALAPSLAAGAVSGGQSRLTHMVHQHGGLPDVARDTVGALAPSLAAGAVSGGQSRLTHMVHQHGGLPGVASDTVEALEPSLAADAVSGGQSQVTHVVHQHGSLPDVARDTVGALAPSLATDAVSGGQSQVTHVVHQHGGLPDVARDTVEALEPSLAADAVSGGKSQVTHVVHQHGGLPDVARDTVEALAPSLAADAVSGGQSQVTHVVHQHGCAVAQAAAAAWQASQGSDVELEYALPLGNMNTPSKKSTTTTAAASNSSPEDNNNVGASWSVHPIAGLPAGTEGGGTDRLLMAKGEGAPTARSGRPSAEIACGPESARDDDDASFSADERQWRLQVSRSQQEVAEVLRSMGCQGIQVPRC
ncbi:hypothetical protein DUNSADRAFT_2833 [Dunaliella salina]|uniref:Uncharacterized protein n=1 Tax=Dunaliella salina TaxID=3046 RepID=A0ABQ7GUZ4_DUNSA|nr:hypothetical protein DUNSADRAFT_2833 [Dunaliella salina]|eukprot:KAF5838439.1 hypothetical protein DUNSADRAFT_2833 [Dunaliella salina]